MGPLLERSCLPVSCAQHLTGTLEQGPTGLVLRTDGGGTWELDATRQARKLVGARVEVVGRRSGFNGLACEQIWPAGQPRPRESRLRFELLIAAAFVAYGLYATIAGMVSWLG